MAVPECPKLYHIVHHDRLPSVIASGELRCDVEVAARGLPGTTIGMNAIKQRRRSNELASHPGLHVGECVPFYFCPRSVMLYLLNKGNHPDLAYRGGQPPIVHLEFDLNAVVAWADGESLRWAFTLTNAGSRMFEDRANLRKLDDIDWDAVKARRWEHCKDEKQAEFLVENKVPWSLVERVGVYTRRTHGAVADALEPSAHQPPVAIVKDWYY